MCAVLIYGWLEDDRRTPRSRDGQECMRGDVRRASLRRSRKKANRWEDEFGWEWLSHDVSVGGNKMDGTGWSDVEFSGQEFGSWSLDERR